jgi:hypothetical protein
VADLNTQFHCRCDDVGSGVERGLQHRGEGGRVIDGGVLGGSPGPLGRAVDVVVDAVMTASDIVALPLQFGPAMRHRCLPVGSARLGPHRTGGTSTPSRESAPGLRRRTAKSFVDID